jgi:hypothetical protein
MRSIVLSLFVLTTAVLFANGGPIEDGSIGTGQIKRISSKTISIEDEILTIDLKKGYANVSVIYRMKNSGDSTTVNFGFPSIIWAGEYSKQSNWSQIEIEDYVIRDGSKLVNSSLKYNNSYDDEISVQHVVDSYESSGPYVAWHTSKLQFEKNETKTVSISYTSNYLISGYEVGETTHIEDPIFQYLLSYGSGWKGPIKRGKVIIKADTIGSNNIQINNLNRFKKIKNSYVWNFTHLEPSESDNIKIIINHSFERRAFYSGNGDFSTVISYQNGIYHNKRPDGTIKASSTLQSYSAVNAFDWKRETAWVEGAANAGVSESIDFSYKNRKNKV